MASPLFFKSVPLWNEFVLLIQTYDVIKQARVMTRRVG